jgi:gamma-carbonic anhydrase
MIVLPFDGKVPKVGRGAYVAPNATLIGDVELGDDASIWFGTVVRGDIHSVRIGARTNIQDNCVLHVTAGTAPVNIAEEVTIGHGVIAHGCTIERGALIGMGSRVLDGSVIGAEALVGAGAVVSEGMHVPPRTLVVGVPARVKRPLTPGELTRLDQSWRHYVQVKDAYLRSSSG